MRGEEIGTYGFREEEIDTGNHECVDDGKHCDYRSELVALNEGTGGDGCLPM